MLQMNYLSLNLYQGRIFCLRWIKLSHSKWFEPRSISSLYNVIVRVRVVLGGTVVGEWRFDNLSRSHLQSLKTTSAQVAEMSVANSSFFQSFPHPDDHAIQTKIVSVG